MVRSFFKWLFIGVLSIFVPLASAFVYWLMRSKAEVSRVVIGEQPAAAPALEVKHELDDLKRIEGVGPKISGVLRSAGIVSFDQLASTDVAQLREILTQAGIRLADPATWPEQADLAAADDWEALARLQDELVGGRRV
jgi:predicted flap endonuclease-1-like 5' DNA nuclease